MHTKLATIALAAAAAAAPIAASAQSSVTVYGLLDMYMQYGKGDGTQTQIQSGGPQGSRLGFKGTEDLGNGLKALFQLEMGINADTGASGQGGLRPPGLRRPGVERAGHADAGPSVHPAVRDRGLV